MSHRAGISVNDLGPYARRQVDNLLLAERIRDELKAERKNKYGAKRVQIDGIWFDSKAEGDRYGELKLEERAGLIANLQCHPAFDLIVNGVSVGKYEADFAYFRDNARVVEDVKSKPTKTRLYELKRRIVEALYPGTKITEVMK